MAARTIHLRRPPTLSLQEGPFVPQPRAGVDVMDEVDRRWGAMRVANPTFHDGRICHVLGVHRNGHGGVVIHVMDCAYRFHAVQDAEFDLGVRHLGVKAMTSHDGRLLLGRRSSTVRAYPGMWEFAPGGVIEPGRAPADVLKLELQEETGLSLAVEPKAIAVIFDPVVRCWEIIYQLEVADPNPKPVTDEYTELRWCEPGQWPQPLSPATVQLINR